MGLSFKTWLAEHEQNEGWGKVGGYLKGASSFAQNVVGDALGLPELGNSLDGLGTYAKAAYQSSGLDKALRKLTPEEIEFAKTDCYKKRNYGPCKLLCDKLQDKGACNMIGLKKVGRTWRQSPLA